MKKLTICFFLFLSIEGFAQERKAYSDIVLDEIILDTQKTPEGTSDTHFSFVWWLTYEYWASVLSRDPNLSEAMLESTLEVLDDYMILAIVQADISIFGAFNYYPKDVIDGYLKAGYQVGEKIEYISPIDDPSVEMEAILASMAPLLRAAMGEMGANLHFYIYEDSCLLYTSPSPRDQRGSRMPSSA